MRFVRAIAILSSLLHFQIVAAQGEASRPPVLNEPVSTRQNVASTNADASWRPSQQQIAAVEATTRAYFAARDANRASEAYAFLSPMQKQGIPSTIFTKILDDFNAKAGPASAKRLRAVTWYKDTQQTGPGLFVAVDYSSDYENLALHCGYLIWQEQPDGAFLQLREEVNVIEKAMMEKLRTEDLERVRAQFQC